MLLWCRLIKYFISKSTWHKPNGRQANSIQGREKWPDPTWNVQIDLSRLLRFTPTSNHIPLCFLILTQYRSVTDGRICRSIYNACKASRSAVKTIRTFHSRNDTLCVHCVFCNKPLLSNCGCLCSGHNRWHGWWSVFKCEGCDTWSVRTCCLDSVGWSAMNTELMSLCVIMQPVIGCSVYIESSDNE